VTDAPRRVTRVAAYAVCTDEGGRLLLCRIAPGHSVGFDGWWTLPGGGLDHGEDPRDGALRELTEETGYVGELEELLEIDSWHTVFADPREGEDLDWHGIRILYRCRIVGGELRDEPDGSTDTCRWFTPDELSAERLVDIAELAAKRIGVA
jgi:ADP-ribose pyrophosphatase YjhB (NUDIX family)